MSGTRRTNGLQPPLSPYQLGTAMVHVSAGATFVPLILAAELSSARSALSLGAFGVLFVVILALWLHLGLTDPAARTGGIPYPCMRFSSTQTRYCATCRKQVPGLDHHCVWLNTCIGRRNYVPFFALSVAGTAHYALMCCVSGLVALDWRSDSTLFVVLGAAHALASFGIFVSFATLVGFHVKLWYLGVGTYDWLMGYRPAPRPAPTPGRSPAAADGGGATATSAKGTPASPAARSEREAALEQERQRWAARYGDAGDARIEVEMSTAVREAGGAGSDGGGRGGGRGGSSRVAPRTSDLTGDAADQAPAAPPPALGVAAAAERAASEPIAGPGDGQQGAAVASDHVGVIGDDTAQQVATAHEGEEETQDEVATRVERIESADRAPATATPPPTGAAGAFDAVDGGSMETAPAAGNEPSAAGPEPAPLAAAREDDEGIEEVPSEAGAVQASLASDELPGQPDAAAAAAAAHEAALS